MKSDCPSCCENYRALQPLVRHWRIFAITGLVVILTGFFFAQASPGTEINSRQVEKEVEKVLQLTFRNPGVRADAIDWIQDNHRPEMAGMLLQAYRFTDTPTRDAIAAILTKSAGKTYGDSWADWMQWLWTEEPAQHPHMAEFMGRLHEPIDKRFTDYFDDNPPSRIRLDEIVWGGVQQDGIPPLRRPKMISVQEADEWLEHDHVVFGIEVEGDVRAYPKRILAWHEMFVDKVGGENVAGVYCTLCGSMILYKTEVDGRKHEVGTSGFLYRSNKLMYDKRTSTLWNTLTGEPVVGPLVGKGIALERLSVVTTSWVEWRRRHPETQVLSLETGHQRDYGEGVAYRDYFANDSLMFPVPDRDQRLNNKSEVLALRFPDQPKIRPIAHASSFLRGNPVYQGKAGRVNYVILTDKSGASRVYETKEERFTSWDQDQTAKDESGTIWKVTEAGLIGPNDQRLPRLPAHRAFWFGWHAQYPETHLVGS